MVNTDKINRELFQFFLSLTEKERELPVDDNWTVKDVVSHLIGWNVEASRELPKSWKTGEDPWFMNTNEYEEFNQRFVDEIRNLSGKEVLQKFIESEKQFNNVIKKIGEDNLRKNIKKYSWVFDEGDDNHYLEHFNQIKRVVEKYRNTIV